MDPPAIGDITEEHALDLGEVKRLAAEEHYELIYFSKESLLVSFQPVADARNRDANGDDEINDDVRINVYWTTGTVGTCFYHSVRGRTQLFRRDVDLMCLGDIFRNPRVDTGVGYYETPHREGSSDELQQRRRASLDHDQINILQETNQMLREQLDHSQHIQITGPHGEPVYAAGSFRDGRWLLKRGGLWGVDLSMATSTHDDDDGSGSAGSEVVVPISALEDIEIRLGGIIYATATSHDVYAQMEEQDWDDSTRKEVLCHLGGPVTGAWLAVRIDGWPQSHWSVVQKRDFSRRSNEYRENLDVFEVLLEDVPDLYPEATISFHRLSFFGNCVNQMVDSLGLDPQSEGKGQEGEEMWNIANLIVAELRAAGNEDIGEAFMKRVNDLQMATFMKITINNESNKEVEAEIPALVQMQLASQSTAEFLCQVQSTYGISSLPGS